MRSGADKRIAFVLRRLCKLAFEFARRDVRPAMNNQHASGAVLHRLKLVDANSGRKKPRVCRQNARNHLGPAFDKQPGSDDPRIAVEFLLPEVVR